MYSKNAAVLSISYQERLNVLTKKFSVKYHHIRNLRGSRNLSLNNVRMSE